MANKHLGSTLESMFKGLGEWKAVQALAEKKIKALKAEARKAKPKKKPTKAKKAPAVRAVVVQKWEESERGWGCRPDGYSLHLTEEDRKEYIRMYWEGMPQGEAPDEYSRPDGTPYTALVDLKTYKDVRDSKRGIREYSNRYPGNEGPDGWLHK